VRTTSSDIDLAQIVAGAEKVLAVKQNIQDVIAYYEVTLAGLKSGPALAPLWFNLGVAHTSAQNFSKAIECYQQSKMLLPTFWQAGANLGNLYERSHQSDQAIVLYETYLKMPIDIEGRRFLSNQLGRLYENEHQLTKAISVYSKSLAIDPTQRDTFQHWFYLRQKQCAWPLGVLPKPLSVNELAGSMGSLSAMAYFDDPTLLNLVCTQWVQRFKKGRTFTHLTKSGQRYEHSKIRIGYVSGDFRMHAVCFLSAELYGLHNRQSFEVYGFDFSKDDGSQVRSQVISGMDHFHSIHDLSDEQAARLIRHHEIDILVDLVGLTAGGRPGIFMYKPAPLQVSYLGFLGPVGIPEIDYLVCDPYVVPAQWAADYGAKPLYMPFYQINNSLRQSAAPGSRESYGLPENAYVFCALNNSYKITEEMFARWMQILRNTHNSVLWLLEGDEGLRENLRSFARLHRVDTERLIFAKPVHPAHYLARFQCADLFLDTSPYNAGITGSDALWMGLPLLTCPGNTYVSRMAASLLLQLKLDEFVCDSWNDYINKAITYCRTNSARVNFNAVFDRQSPIFNSQFFMKNYENSLLALMNEG